MLIFINMARKPAHTFNLDLLRIDDRKEWQSFYNKLRGMLQAKSFTTNQPFNEDIYNDAIIVVRDKLQNVHSTSDLINLTYRIYLNQLMNFYNNRAKFSGRLFIETEKGYLELQPDNIPSHISNIEEEHDKEQFEIDLELLKERFKAIQEDMNGNNHAKYIDLYQLYLDYVTDHTTSLEEICYHYGINSTTAFRYLNLEMQKKFNLKKPIKKASKPFDELKPSGKNCRRKKIKLKMKE